MLKSIIENPYRVLGVYANSPKKDQVANKGKMAAFLRVNKSMSFPLDLKCVLPEITRTQELVDRADSDLSLAEGQLKAAQFWFVKSTPLDEIAFNHLTKGNVDEAMTVWGKQRNVSSLQNSFICSLIKGNYKDAIDNYVSDLYSNYRDAFCALIGDNFHKEEIELINVVLDSIQDESGSIESLYNSVVNPTWKAILSSKVVEPYIKRAESAIAKCKASKGKSPSTRRTAGLTLMSDSKIVLNKLRSLLSTSDSKYRSIADKYAQEILQCGIDYYNALDPYVALEDAMKLQKYALSIAVGAVAKQRCKENVDTLNKTAAQLPPAQIIKNVKNIINKIEQVKSSSYPGGSSALSSYLYSEKNIEKARALLNLTDADLKEIKNKVGTNNDWYIKISTRVCSTALSWVIDDVNSAQDRLTSDISSSIGLSSASTSISRCVSVMNSASSVIDMISSRDFDYEFRSHFNSQRSAFNNIKSSIIALKNKSTGSSYGSSSYGSSSSYSSSGYSSSSSSDDNSGCWWIIGIAIFIIICINAC